MPLKPLVSTDRLADYASFSDESCCDGNHTYMIIGGVLCRSFYAHTLSGKTQTLRNGAPFPESIQWKSMSRAKLKLAKKIVDLFLEENAAQRIDFNCIVFDQTKVDHDRFNDGDPEKGFFKFLYQHYNKHRRTYGRGSSYRCFHGNRETHYDMKEMRAALNNAAAANMGYFVARWQTIVGPPVIFGSGTHSFQGPNEVQSF